MRKYYLRKYKLCKKIFAFWISYNIFTEYYFKKNYGLHKKQYGI